MGGVLPAAPWALPGSWHFLNSSNGDLLSQVGSLPSPSEPPGGAPGVQPWHKVNALPQRATSKPLMPREKLNRMTSNLNNVAGLQTFPAEVGGGLERLG